MKRRLKIRVFDPPVLHKKLDIDVNFFKPRRKIMSPQTAKVLTLVEKGHSVCIVGPAGTGKSWTLRKLIAMMTKKRIRYEITGSTGASIIPFNGTTIHSWSGYNFNASEEQNLNKARTDKYVQARWKQVRVLVIEEISMLKAHIFETLNKMGQIARKSTKPFGGLQLVICGDFLQLEPCGDHMVFESEVFSEIYHPSKNIVYFQEVKRQNDPVFIQILQEARIAQVTPKSLKLLRSRILPKPPNIPVAFPRRDQVQSYNNQELAKIKEPSQTFDARYLASPSLNKFQNQKTQAFLLKNAPMYPSLTLKIGAQVILTQNKLKWHPKKINGSVGTITKFEEKTNNPIVTFDDRSVQVVMKNVWFGPKSRGQLIQYPLIHGWAISIHKSQGATYNALYVTLNYQARQYGQAYTALSRVRSLDGLYLNEDFDPSCFRANPKALEFYRMLEEAQKPQKPQKRKKP